MKTLKAKKLDALFCWGGLRNTPPREFPTVEEIEATGKILDVLKGEIPSFVTLVKEGEEVSDKAMEDPKGDAAKSSREDFAKKSIVLERGEGQDAIELLFEDAEFNTFFQQFERWGRLWFPKTEPFIEFRKAMVETNGQAKDKKKDEKKDK